MYDFCLVNSMRRLVVWFGLLLLLFSCNKDHVNAPDVSNIDGNFELIRMEQSIMEMDSNNIENDLNSLITHNPEFMDIFLTNIMGFTSEDDPNVVINNMKGFVTAPNIRELYQKIEQEYYDMGNIKDEFEKVFQYYKYYFPDRNIPDVYTFLSEYSLQQFLFLDDKGHDALGVGLDLFLGSDYPYQTYFPNNPAFSSYLVRRFNKDHLVKKSMEALVEDIMGPNRGNNLLEKMIHNGKKLYILDHLLPYTSDTIIMEYTPEQLAWCENNELEMWAYLLKEDLFYETSINKINKLVNPSPGSPGMPSEAPGRTGNYMGWKIVETFMERNPNMSLTELINFADAQRLLDISKFKPKN